MNTANANDADTTKRDCGGERKKQRMFCYQCQQTMHGTGCTVAGVCGKQPETAVWQDALTCEMIALAAAAKEKCMPDTGAIVTKIVDGLFTCVTNVNFDGASVAALAGDIKKTRAGFGGADVSVPGGLFDGGGDEQSLRSTLLFGLRGMAAYAHHAAALGKRDPEVDAWFIKGMAALAETRPAGEWLGLLMEFGGVNLKCMSLLDGAHTDTYGDPVPTRVGLTIERGPFIVVTGHDLRDLKMLLEQTENTGVNIYTHGEMLAAHGYPGLKKHPHLKGHYGTAWQNQRSEFKGLPAPVLWTTNCLTPPGDSYADRVYTTSVVRYHPAEYIAADPNGDKDFSALIGHAIQLKGFSENKQFYGHNGGDSMTAGFGRRTLLDNMPVIAEAYKNGAIKRFFLVGGCDGASNKRGYYTEFVRQTPKDTVVLTLACGKFRFNDLELGMVGPFPRVLDMGQCNDAYGAVQVAAALAEALNCGINDLPLNFVLSWYEQKAVCVLLTLLSLGIKNIYIGPTLPAFISPGVLDILVKQFGLTLITEPEADLKKMMRAG